MKEEYIIRYDVKGDDGYWKRNLETTVVVNSQMKGFKEKNNHGIAKKVFLSQNENVTINSIVYV